MEAEYEEVLKRHGFMRSKFEDTRQKAIKFGANGSTVKAYKPEK